MKRFVKRCGWIIMLGSIIFCACNKQVESNDIANIVEPEIMEKDATEVAQLQLGDADVLYGLNEGGTKISSYHFETSEFGEPLVETDGIHSFCYENDTIYYIAFNQLFKVNITSGEITKLATFNGTEFSFGKMVVVGERVFVIRKNDTKELWMYNLTENILERVPDICVESIATKTTDELLIYAYDEESRSYVISYHVQDKSFSEKHYMVENIPDVTDIAYDELQDVILLLNLQGIWMVSEETLSGAAFVYDSNRKMLSSLQCKEGNTYALSRGEQGRLICIDNKTVNFEIPVLKAYTLSEFSNTSNNGFRIQFEEITADELTLKILAEDMDYDFLLVNSQWDLGYHISRIGAYSAMNDIPGVEEFLEECHEFVGEAASMEDGTIWMLPYNVEGAVLCYNETLLREMGLTRSDIDTVEEVYILAEKVISEDSAYVTLPVALLASDMLNKYLANYGIKDGYANYDTEQFRLIADIRKQYEMKAYEGTINFNTFHQAFPKGKPTDEQARVVYERTLLTIERIEDLQSAVRDKSQYNFFHAAPMPDLEDGTDLKDEVEVAFLVINPNSDKLPWVKKYVETLCEELRSDKESFLLKDNTFSEKPMFDEVMDILSDAQVTFLYPTSMVSDGMYSFLFEGQNFDELVKEIERIMNIYMHE